MASALPLSQQPKEEIDNNIEKDTISIRLSYRSKKSDDAIRLSKATAKLTDLQDIVRNTFDLTPDYELKLLHSGKVLDESLSFLRASHHKANNKSKALHVMVMAIKRSSLNQVIHRKSDPTIRGLDDERKREHARTNNTSYLPWGPNYASQNREYKFCKLEACTWQSLGVHEKQQSSVSNDSSSLSKTPHAFEAHRILQKLSLDPGVIAVMKERELVVNTLAEMDPIDDRLAAKQKADAPQSCLLGYNTNSGLRIDLKLRPDNLAGFLPYTSIVNTLLHELSHNWVGEHNALFWANYGQMRVEYLCTHALLSSTGYLVNGRTSAYLAGVVRYCANGWNIKTVFDLVMEDLAVECAPHGVPLSDVAPAIWDRCVQIQKMNGASGVMDKYGVPILAGGNVIGGRNHDGSTHGTSHHDGGQSRRDLIRAAAERRAAKDDNSSSTKDCHSNCSGCQH